MNCKVAACGPCLMEDEPTPCWGKLQVFEEYDGQDAYWHHYCEGHADQGNGIGPYKPEEGQTA